MEAPELFEGVHLRFVRLPGELKASSPDEFMNQFRKLFSQTECRESRGVVYVWITETPVPRLNGGSPIVYIGKTEGNLHDRHAKYARTEAAPGNWERYEHIMKVFGKIAVLYATCRKPAAIEKQFLKKYFDAHLELPPLNRRS
jgi:hypothetical protein